MTEEWKDRIRAGVLMDKLLKHVEGSLEMSQTQIKAADILLKKIVPDLARHDMNHSGQIVVTHEDALAGLERDANIGTGVPVTH